MKLLKQIGMFQKQNHSNLHNDDVVITVDRIIEIEALKAKICSCIPKGETPEETGFNIFSYVYKQEIEHFKR